MLIGKRIEYYKETWVKDSPGRLGTIASGHTERILEGSGIFLGFAQDSELYDMATGAVMTHPVAIIQTETGIIVRPVTLTSFPHLCQSMKLNEDLLPVPLR